MRCAFDHPASHPAYGLECGRRTVSLDGFRSLEGQGGFPLSGVERADFLAQLPNLPSIDPWPVIRLQPSDQPILAEREIHRGPLREVKSNPPDKCSANFSRGRWASRRSGKGLAARVQMLS